MRSVLLTTSAIAICAGVLSAARAAKNSSIGEISTHKIVRASIQRALETMPAGRASFWMIDGVASGVVVPRRTWRSKSGHWCRQFETYIQTNGGERRSLTGVRCRTATGRWLKPPG